MFTHTIYSKIISWFLLLNGLFGLFVSLSYIWNQGHVLNEFTFTLCSIVFPAVSAIFGYFLLLKSSKCLAWLPYYLILSIPEFGWETYLYSHAHGLKLEILIELLGFYIGINFVALVGLILFRKHQGYGETLTDDGDYKTEH